MYMTELLLTSWWSLGGYFRIIWCSTMKFLDHIFHKLGAWTGKKIKPLGEGHILSIMVGQFIMDAFQYSCLVVHLILMHIVQIRHTNECIVTMIQNFIFGKFNDSITDLNNLFQLFQNMVFAWMFDMFYKVHNIHKGGH